jgi:TonB family protein
MTLMLSFLATPTTQTLAWVLVHFLWQGALVALVAAAAMRWVARSARARYLTGVVALGLMLAAPVATFVILQPAAPSAVPAASEISLAALVSVAGEVAAPSATAAPGSFGPPMVLSTLVALWLAGVLVLSVRLLGGWVVARRLATTAGRDVDDDVQDLASRVAERLQLNRLVRIAESSTVAVPVVVGWLKPVVLLPAAALSGLAPAHIEALLAHELAHVRRHDYLVNLLQTAVETLLFYHPGVWWLSRRVRIEREHCCDDLAVSVCDRFVYVNALTDLATMTTHARLALAATDGSLLGRVRRLLATDADDRPGAGWLSIVVLAIMAAALTPALLALGGDQQPPTVPAPSAAPKATTAIPSPQPSVAIPAAAATTAVPRQQPAAMPEPQRTDVEAVRQQMVQVEAQLAALRREQREVEAERAREENALRREAAMARLAALERALAEATTRREIGLTSEAPVEDVRAQVEAARRELRLIEVESRTASAALSLEARREQAEEMYGRLQQQYAAALAETETRRAHQTSPVPPPPGVYTVGGDVREPRLLKRVEPLYPPVAKAAKMQGPVYVQAIIARDGQVRDATVVGGVPFPVLREAALAAVRQWGYEPTVLNGQPVEVQLSIQVNFRLNDGGSSAAPAPPVNAFPVSDATAQVQTGDILLVDIAGEDQIPRWYVVTGGAIRLPLIGSIKVAGLTAEAVRASVSRALAERGLAQGKAVTVTIHRPR